MEDICIGRKSFIRERRVAVTGSTQQLVGADPDRIHLRVGIDDGSTFTLSFLEGVLATVGMAYVGAAQPAQFDIQKDGKAATMALFGFSAAASSWTVIETILQKECEQ